MLDKFDSVWKLWFLYGIPLIALSAYPHAVSYFGEFSSPFFSLVYQNSLVNINATGIIYDLLIIYSLYIVLAAQKKRRHEYIFQECVQFFKHYILNQESLIEWHHLRVYFIKLFFTPLMLMFFLGGIYYLPELVMQMSEAPNVHRFVFLGFVLFYYSAITVDVSYFALGYLFESDRLDNVIESTDPYPSGWLACLICYPPFLLIMLSTTGGVMQFTERYFVYSEHFTLTVTGIALIFVTTYAWASVSLGFKASNLTYRGIVTRGAYSIVRHPAYISKVIIWSLLTVPMIIFSNAVFIVPLILWAGVYYMRAITEERHLLLANEQGYHEYQKQVPYRFIPGVW